MWTIEYKGGYIHGYTDKPECGVQYANTAVLWKCKSLHAAKLLITKFIKAGV